MPYLTEDYLNRYQRLRQVCFDAYESRVEQPRLHRFDEPPHPIGWRHADLFLAAFPRVHRRPGFDVLCWFTQGDPNCFSGLIGYSVGVPEMVLDPFDVEAVIRFDDESEDALLGTAEVDGKVLRVPAMPAAFQNGHFEDLPSWLHRDINSVIEDDGTPEGIFERSQLLLWSREPINQWHAVGYGNHRLLTEAPAAESAGLLPVAGEEGAPLPDNWLPQAEESLSASSVAWATLPPDQAECFAGKPCKVARFYTYTHFFPARVERNTIWMADDCWHEEIKTVLKGEFGAIS